MCELTEHDAFGMFDLYDSVRHNPNVAFRKHSFTA